MAGLRHMPKIVPPPGLNEEDRLRYLVGSVVLFFLDGAPIWASHDIETAYEIVMAWLMRSSLGKRDKKRVKKRYGSKPENQSFANSNSIILRPHWPEDLNSPLLLDDEVPKADPPKDDSPEDDLPADDPSLPGARRQLH